MPLPIKTQGKRIQQQPVAPPPAMIVLEMREEVAETLQIILRNVGGPETGRRGHASEVISALNEAGIISSSLRNHPDKTSGLTTIEFRAQVTR